MSLSHVMKRVMRRSAGLFDDALDVMRKRPSLTAFCGFLLLALFLLHPMIIYLGSYSFHLSSPTNGHNEDTLHAAMVMYHKAVNLLSFDLSRYFDLPTFHPYKDTLLFSDPFISETLAGLPFFALGVSPHMVHDILLWLSFPLAAFSMFMLCQFLFNRPVVAFVCGLCYGFCPYQLNHLIHLSSRFVMFFPLTVLFFLRYFKTRSWKDLCLFSVFFLLHALSNGYYFLFGNVFLFILAASVILIHRREITMRSLASIFVAVTFACIPMLLLYWPYLEFSRIHDLHKGHILFSATFRNFVDVFSSNWLWGKALGPGPHERTLFFGLLPLSLAVYGVLARNKEGQPEPRMLRWVFLFCSILALLLCLGNSIVLFGARIPMPYLLLNRHVPGFNAMRVTSRMGLFFCFFTSLLVGSGLIALSRIKRLRHHSRWILPLVVLFITIEYTSIPLQKTQVVIKDKQRDSLLEWLGSRRHPSPVLNLPTGSGYDGIQARYGYDTIFHEQPILGGKSSNLSRLFEFVRDFSRDHLNPSTFPLFVEMLKSVGIRYIICWDPGSKEARLLHKASTQRRDIHAARRFGDYVVFELGGSSLRKLKKHKKGQKGLDLHFEPLNMKNGNLTVRFHGNGKEGMLFNPVTRHRVLVKVIKGSRRSTCPSTLLLPPLLSGKATFEGDLRMTGALRLVKPDEVVEMSSLDASFTAGRRGWDMPPAGERNRDSEPSPKSRQSRNPTNENPGRAWRE